MMWNARASRISRLAALQAVFMLEHAIRLGAISQRMMSRDSSTMQCANLSSPEEFRCSLPPSDIPSIVFIKTHKTGGSTFANILNRIGDRRQKVFMSPKNYCHLGWPQAFPGDEDLGELHQQFEMLTSHAVYSTIMHEYMKGAQYYVTLLREPGSQAVSAFYYWTKSDVTWDGHLEKLGHCDEDFNEDSKWEARFCNPQAHDLGWYNWNGGTREHDHDSFKIGEWIETLAYDFGERGMVIPTEMFDEGLVLLSIRLGLNIDEVSYNKIVNPGDRGRPREQETDEMRNDVRKLLPVDVQLYNNRTVDFKNKWASAQSKDTLEKLTTLRELNLALAADRNLGKPFTMEPSDYQEYLQFKRNCEHSG
eukprot:TRINITY_DN74863_c0_g1_i1.p1 TRINITY_DN74863_c0_g1~~TRINITY_DN74863_c0_g1_i1.p1  ORF type:complete len:364 (+),score=32.65 TRINITY_DN74863_c0_g1_i1:107-1198(+)